MHTLVTVRMIARATKADGGIIMSDGTDSIASAYDPFTWVIYWGHLANSILNCVSRVTHADVSASAKGTTPMLTAIDPKTCIGGDNAIASNAVVALVTYTQRFIGAGDQARAIVTTVNVFAWCT